MRVSEHRFGSGDASTVRTAAESPPTSHTWTVNPQGRSGHDRAGRVDRTSRPALTPGVGRSPLITKHSMARQHIYRTLLDHPHGWWTTKSIIAALPEHAEVSSEAVRSTFNVLLTVRVLTRVPGQRALTGRLTPEGVALLRFTLSAWAGAAD